MDRRCTSRIAQSGHVWWRRGGEAFPERGWTTDRSWGGIGFISPYANRLHLGDTLEISEAPDPSAKKRAPSERYEVRRTAALEAGLTFVAVMRCNP